MRKLTISSHESEDDPGGVLIAGAVDPEGVAAPAVPSNGAFHG